jgi:hypothetical protein
MKKNQVVLIARPDEHAIWASPYLHSTAKATWALLAAAANCRPGQKVHYVDKRMMIDMYPLLFGGSKLRQFQRDLAHLREYGLVDYAKNSKRPEISVYVPTKYVPPKRRVACYEEETIIHRRRMYYAEDGPSTVDYVQRPVRSHTSPRFARIMNDGMRIADRLPDTPKPRLPEWRSMLATTEEQKCISRQIADKSDLIDTSENAPKRTRQRMRHICRKQYDEDYSYNNNIYNKTSSVAYDKSVASTFAGRGKLGEILEGTSLAGILPTSPQSPPPPADSIEGTCEDADEIGGTAQLPSTPESYEALEGEAVRRPRWTRAVSYDKARQAYAIAEAVGVPAAERGVLALMGLWFDLYRAEFGATYRPHRVHDQARAIYAELSKLLAEEDAARLDGAMRFFLSSRKTAFKRIRCWRIGTFCKIIGDVLAAQVQHRDVEPDRKGDKKNSYGSRRGVVGNGRV